MPRLPPLSARWRAIALLGAIVLGVLLLAAVSFVGSEIQAGVRAYVTGESLWSRGRARAVEALGRYARMGRQEHWQEYREAIDGPLATRRARVELDSEDPDLERIYAAFAELGLPEDEMDPMIHLYRWLGGLGALEGSRGHWARADSLIRRLRDRARELRRRVRSAGPGSDPAEATLLEIEALSRRMDRLGRRFTDSVAATGRRVRTALLAVFSVAVLLVLVVSGTGTWWFVRSTERREREYRNLVSAAPVPMAVQRDGIFQFVNEAFARLVGAGDVSELEGASALDYLPETEHGEIRERIRRAQEGERAETRERRWIRRDGSERVTKVTGIPVDYGGESAALVIAQDVTDERRARRRLRRSEEKYRSLFEASQDAIYLSRPDGTIEELNPAGRELLGVSEEDVAEIDAVDLYHDPGDRERFKRAIGEDGGVQEFDVELVTRDGEVRHCELAATARRDQDGEIRGYQGIIRDVTERKRFQEELEWQALHDGLTGLANRTLLWDRLEQAVVRSARGGGKVGVVFVDLDRFKAVNDRLGHAAGDQLLQEVADRLRVSVRDSDTAARVAGDEFVLLLEDLRGRGEAEEVVDRVTQAFERAFTVEGREIGIGVSVGLTVEGIEEDVTDPRAVAERLMREADSAMYRDKERSRTSPRDAG